MRRLPPGGGAAVPVRLPWASANRGGVSSPDDLGIAADQVEAPDPYGPDPYGPDPARLDQLTAEVHGRALDWVVSGDQGSVTFPLPARPGWGRWVTAGGRTPLGNRPDQRYPSFGPTPIPHAGPADAEW